MDEIDDRMYFVGDVRAFELVNATKDGQLWVLSSVTLVLVDPSGVLHPYTATQLSAYTWSYVTSNNELSAAGSWRRYWRLSDGSNSETAGYTSFDVQQVT